MKTIYFIIQLLGILISRDQRVHSYPCSEACDVEWFESPEGHSYKIFPPRVRGNWEQAQEICEKCGAHIAYPTTLDEMYWLHGFVSNEAYPGGSHRFPTEGYWMGGFSNGTDFYWKTPGENNPNVKISWNMWKINEPNSFKKKQTCIHYWSSGGFWADSRCTQRYGVICML